VIRPTRKASLSSDSARSRSASDARRSPGGKPLPTAALNPEQLEKLRQRYDEAAAFGIDAIRAALKEKP
jgi:hypothetical protein